MTSTIKYSCMMVIIYLMIPAFGPSGMAQNIPDSILLVIQNQSVAEQVDYLGQLCWENRELDRELALSLGVYAQKLAINNQFDVQVARISNYIGVIFLHYFFDHKSAVPALHTALEYALKVHDSTQIAYAYNNLGDAFYLNSNFPIAFEYGTKSLEYFTALQDTNGIAYSMVNLGLAYRLDGQLQKAIEFFGYAYDYGKSKGNKTRMANAKQEMAISYFQMDSLNLAKGLFLESYKLNSEINNHTYSAYCQTGLGDVYYHQAKYDSAQSCYEFSQRLLEGKNIAYAEISNLLGMARILAVEGKLPQGAKLLDDARQMATNLGVNSKIIECYMKTTEFYRIAGDFEKASTYFSAFMFAADKAFQSQQFDILNETQERFKIQHDYSESQNALEAEKQKEKYLVLVVIMAVLLAVVFFWRYRSHVRLNRELATSNHDKDKLFSIISHDLRKPFIGLLNYVELIKEDDLSPEKRLKFVANLETLTRSTYSLLENLLNLSASKNGKISFQPQAFSLADLIQDLTVLLQPQLEHKDLRLETELHQETLFADRQMMEIVLNNLLSNAIKYSHPGGEILLQSLALGDDCHIKIVDQGIGIDKRVINELFHAELIDSLPGTDGEKGTGIGLSLCKEFVDKHEGSIEVVSAPGQGSEFMVILPQK